MYYFSRLKTVYLMRSLFFFPKFCLWPKCFIVLSSIHHENKKRKYLHFDFNHQTRLKLVVVYTFIHLIRCNNSRMKKTPLLLHRFPQPHSMDSSKICDASRLLNINLLTTDCQHSNYNNMYLFD